MPPDAEGHRPVLTGSATTTVRPSAAGEDGRSLTPAQLELARHALGLPNDRRRSYRNRYLAGGGSPEWDAMVEAGLTGDKRKPVLSRRG